MVINKHEASKNAYTRHLIMSITSLSWGLIVRVFSIIVFRFGLGKLPQE